MTRRALAARFHCCCTRWSCRCELTHSIVMATFCKALRRVPILIPFCTGGYIACVRSTVMMSCIFIERRASCFAGSAGNVVKFQTCKSRSSEKQGFHHNETALGPKWKLLTWSFVTWALESVLPCRTSFLQQPFLHCILLFHPQPEHSTWTSHPLFTEEVQKVQVTHSSSSWAPKGQGGSKYPGVSEPDGFPHLLYSCLESCSLWIYFMRFFSLKVPSCPPTSFKHRTVQLTSPLPATGVQVSPGNRTFWHLRPTCTKIKS